MAAVMKELRAQRIGIGMFIRAWVEQDDTQRTRRRGILRKFAPQDTVLREAFGIDEVLILVLMEPSRLLLLASLCSGRRIRSLLVYMTSRERCSASTATLLSR